MGTRECLARLEASAQMWAEKEWCQPPTTGKKFRGPRPLRATPTLLQGNIHLAIEKALITRFLPDTLSNAPAATCVLRGTFYLFYFFRQRHVSSKIAGRAMRGNIA